MELLQWWNLIFLLPVVCAGLYHLLLATGAVPAGHDSHGDLDADADVALDHDAALDHDVTLEHGVEHAAVEAHGAHGEVHAGTGAFGQALTLLGIGKVPLSIILVSWCYIWGVAGYASNQLLGSFLPAGVFAWLSLGIATVAAVVLTRYLADALARVLPKTETYGVYTRDLVGRPAVVRYRVTATFGSAQVHDQYGTLHEVDCRTRPDDPPIPAGTRVALVDYDEGRRVFVAVPI